MSGKKISVTAGEITLEAELYETETAGKIFDILPVTGRASVWGEEIYFEIPLHLVAETDAREEVEVGELGYWPTGSAFCIFFGPTPMSTGDQPRAYSPVNVFGRVIGDAKQLTAIADGAAVRVERVG